MNTENLLKLAAYLMSGNLQARFDMWRFDDRHAEAASKETCGTIGCAIGHGPYAGILKTDSESWPVYAVRAFGVSIFSYKWTWIFDSAWGRVDNTPEGAGKRILHMIRHGVPRDWEGQLTGRAKLSYVDETL